MAPLNCMRRCHLIAFLMLFSAPRTAYPCSTVVVVSRTGPNFSVIVENDGKPIQGIQVKIGTQYSDITDQSGTVRFRHIPPGSYDVRATNAAGYGSDLAIEVRKGERSTKPLQAQWPPDLLFSAPSMEGRISLPPQLTPRTIHLELLEASSGRVLNSLDADETGAFRFPSLASGLYLLLASWDAPKMTQMIPVKVDPDKATRALDIHFIMTSCGLMYDHSQ